MMDIEGSFCEIRLFDLYMLCWKVLTSFVEQRLNSDAIERLADVEEYCEAIFIRFQKLQMFLCKIYPLFPIFLWVSPFRW